MTLVTYFKTKKMKEDNLELWNKVEKTNPNYTKKAKVNGNSITSIAPQYQIMNATEQFGVYGATWGFKNIELDYSLVNIPYKMDKTKGSYPNIEVIGKEDSTIGIVVFKAVFFHPKGEFEIINSIDIFTSNKRNKVDDNFAKKLETDTLTKALSKLGFNADIFLGKFDDERYLKEVTEEFSPPKKEIVKGKLTEPIAIAEIEKGKTVEQIKALYHVDAEQEKKLIKMFEDGQK